VELKKLTHAYKDQIILDDFSIHFEKQMIHCLFGPSGCGKTTLFRILAGLIPLEKDNSHILSSSQIAYVFQEERLLPWLNAYENVAFVLDQKKHSVDDIKMRVNHALELVQLGNSKEKFPAQLSGGMRQRVSLARAFAYGGEFLLLDEPFKGLDIKIKKTLMDYIISYWHEVKPSILFITHDVDEALYIADAIHVLKGPPLEVVKRYNLSQVQRNERADNKDILKIRQALLT
jgi:NitT/TauT family transport system ATP-binding protein